MVLLIVHYLQIAMLKKEKKYIYLKEKNKSFQVRKFLKTAKKKIKNMFYYTVRNVMWHLANLMLKY